MLGFFLSLSKQVAKVARDRMIESWKFTEQPNFEAVGGLNFGSGYPSDPKCQKWMESNLMDPVFCFPDLVRFSWGPARADVDEGGVKVAWEDEEDEDEAAIKKQQEQMKAFLGGAGSQKKKKPRLAYFEKRRMSRVTKLTHY
jgi:ribonuclease H2 subunit A